ncbi:MAG: penicillin-binding protein [Clostridiales bacterium]|nr:penicillin-binding protein [Clostridiales bacterium]
MEKTTKRGYVLIILIVLFVLGVAYLTFLFFTKGSSWSSNRANSHIYSSGRITSAGNIYDRNGRILAETKNGKRVYSGSSNVRRATLHIVGDTSGVISTGVQSVFKSKLTGYSFLNGIYSLKKYGRGNDIRMTIDADACAAGLNALNGHKGTVGVFNYKTGALLCCVSAPTYDINNVPSDIRTNPKYEGVYLNRLFSGVYTPGSTFKIITSLSALQNIPGVELESFDCEGSKTISGGKLVCMKHHGVLTFEQALNNSCNCAFADISLKLGKTKLAATAKSLLFNVPIKADGINLAISTFNVSSADDLELAWAGVGQATTLVNPCHMMMIAGAVANGGVGVMPYVVDEITNQNDITIYRAGVKNSTISIEPALASKLRDLLRSNVKNQYGDYRFPDLSMCGKTGTAEVNGKESHSWFVGFSQRADFPVAVVAVAENAGSGSGVAMSAANAVLQSLLK